MSSPADPVSLEATAAPIQPQPWTRRRWVFTVAFAVVLHLAAVFWFSDRSPIRPRNVPPLLRLAVATDPLDRGTLALLDPTLFALPNPAGFAGRAWIQASDHSYQPAGWTEPSDWLAARGEWFEINSRKLNVETAPTYRTFAAKAPAPLAVVQVPPVPVAGRTTVELDGALTQRGLIAPIEAPSVVHSNLLESTRVEVCVDATGGVFSAVMLEGSGLDAADERALALAQAARFHPQPSGDGSGSRWTWGRMTFHWAVVELPATNPPARFP